MGVGVNKVHLDGVVASQLPECILSGVASSGWGWGVKMELRRTLF
jgi:hypothetical protein